MNRVLVSVVANAGATETSDTDIKDIFHQIKAGKWIDLIEEIRAQYRYAVLANLDPKEAVAKLKRKLPGVLWSGGFTSRRKPVAEKLLTYSGLLCADLDELGERVLELRSKLVTSPHLCAVFRSPTGNGLKAVFRVAGNAKEHAASFYAVERHVYELTGIKIDPACKDVSRLCFVSYDPDLWLNPVDPAELIAVAGLALPIRLNAECCIATSLHDYKSASLHNKAEIVLSNIKAKRDALASLAAKHPNLVRIYTKLIEPRYQAQPHARNAFIVQAVPFIYHAVAAPFVLELVGCFYDCNRHLFNDSREQHMNEAKAMLESVINSYTRSLTADEQGIYAALPEDQQDAFRICRDLAMLPEPVRQSLSFYMSFNELGDRLGRFPMQAQRIMRQMESYGLLKQLQKGTRRAPGVRGEAGTYQWLLVEEEKL